MERPLTMGRTEQPMAMKWQDRVTLVLGVWLLFSPWILGFHSSMPGASWNFFLLGIAFVVFAAFGLSLRTAWEEWVTLVLDHVYRPLQPPVVTTGRREPRARSSRTT